MSSLRPKKGTAEYAEQIADDPSDFIDEEDDNEPDKDGCKSEEEDDNDNEDDEDDDEAGVSMTKSALASENKKLKAQLDAANAALKSASSASSMGRVRYDHETTKKNLIKNTEPVRALMETLKDDYESVYYMWSLCDYWKSLMPLDRVQNNEHITFIKYFRKERHLYGLPAFVAATPSPAGSKTSSRAASVALVDESIEEDEDEEEAEETK
jgi:hypothetical protein